MKTVRELLQAILDGKVCLSGIEENKYDEMQSTYTLSIESLEQGDVIAIEIEVSSELAEQIETLDHDWH